MTGENMLRTALRTVLTENGITETNGDLHSWRCEYPEQFGACHCVDDLLGDLIAAIQDVQDAQTHVEPPSGGA